MGLETDKESRCTILVFRQRPAVCGGGGEIWEAERQKAALRMGRASALDPSWLSEGGTSAFPPSDLQHRSQELEGAQEVPALPYDALRGLWGVPASVTPKEIQDDSASQQTRRRWWQHSLPLTGPQHLAQCVHC